MTLTSKEIMDGLYGPDGLYKRIIDKIDELNAEEPRKASLILKHSSQGIYDFKRHYRDPEQSRPKLDTLYDWAKKLGVE